MSNMRSYYMKFLIKRKNDRKIADQNARFST